MQASGRLLLRIAAEANALVVVAVPAGATRDLLGNACLGGAFSVRQWTPSVAAAQAQAAVVAAVSATVGE